MNLPERQTVLELLTPHRLFAKMNIAGKMLLGYLTLVALSVVVVVYALVSLQRLSHLNSEIIRVSIPVQQTADRMLDALIAQDTHEKRYLILRRKDLRYLFWQRAEEFKGLLADLRGLSGLAELPLRKIGKLHARYNDLFMSEIRLVRRGDSAGAEAVSDRELKNTFDKLANILRAVSVNAKQSRDARMQKISEIGGPAFFTTAALCLLSIGLGVLINAMITHHISFSIHKLRAAAAQVAEGKFHYDPGIDTQDEIGALARGFLAMGKKLIKFEEMYLDASPLTRLPGGLAIENVMKHRLESGRPLALCVIDLDHFKAFNDRYGYAHGNVVIKETAKIIEGAAKTKGSPDDFVGHVGGDDFVVITTPAFMRGICTEIIRLFDERSPRFYNETDRAKCYIIGKTRQGREMRFPCMTISIAVVTNEKRAFTNTLEAAEIAAELKDYAKTIPQSVFVVDKRRAG